MESLGDLDGHRRSGHQSQEDCGVKFESFGDLDNHRKSAHLLQEDKFESFGDSDGHRRIAHQEGCGKKTFQCIKCQIAFESELEIEAHVACHVMQEGTQHECRLCHEVSKVSNYVKNLNWKCVNKIIVLYKQL